MNPLSPSPTRLPRSESFFGVHFDFHAGDDCTEIGRTLTNEMLEEMLEAIRPDYVQCDCKGHPGVSSYPTEVGRAAPGFILDPLLLWRTATEKRGVALYMHYSGVWDAAAIQAHPDWARINENGKPDLKNTSVFGPYVDELLIPQLKELRDRYKVDGVWIDGDCWATCQDYGSIAVEEFRRTTGIQDIPRKSEDPHFFEFTEFCREGFRRYLRRYVDALHLHDPQFEIASNWAFSSFMPEPVSAGVDFISGDYPLMDSVRAARLEARCMMRQGKPWDLMAWSFAARFGEKGPTTKTVVQLQQEAAIVLALGGGFQVYCKQKRDGAIERWPMKVVAEVAQFCRARQQICHRAEAVPQIALLLSKASVYRNSKRLFSPWDGELTALRGTLDALLDGQHVVEIAMEHQLAGRLPEYSLVVVPEWSFLEPSFRDELLDYVKCGGNLLVIGPAAAKIFQHELGLAVLEEPVEKARFIECQDALAGIFSRGSTVQINDDTRSLALCYANNDRDTPEIVATYRKLGEGRIAGLYIEIGERYMKARTTVLRDLLTTIVRELFPLPIIEVRGSHTVDVMLMRKAGQLYVHLVNTAGPHADENVYTFDEIPSVGPLEIRVRLREKPLRVTLLPEELSLSFDWSEDELKVELSRLELHAILQISGLD